MELQVASYTALAVDQKTGTWALSETLSSLELLLASKVPQTYRLLNGTSKQAATYSVHQQSSSGKVYVGSEDKNFYCLNAYTGQKIWNFTIGFYLRSSPSCYNGRVYTGADDGFFYGLDANTGAQVWKTATGGIFPNLLNPGEAKAFSSPIVVNNMIYCGSRDGLSLLSKLGRKRAMDNS